MLTGSGSFRGSLRAVFAAGALLLGSTGLAQAQWFGFGYHRGYHGGDFWQPNIYRPNIYRPPVVMDELTPREVVNSLRARGFRDISRPVYQDDVAIVRAVNPSGRPVRLVIDIYSGRIVDRQAAPQPQPQRPQVVQRVPDQGPTIRRTVPDSTEKTRATPERPTTIKREPMLPPQTTTPSPPKNRVVQPEKPQQPAKPPEASVGSGTKAQPRRIDMVPPAELDAPPEKPRAPVGPPINSVPPAALE
jgi:hypothetical protein